MIANLQNTMYNAVAGVMRNPDANALGGAGGQTASLMTSPFFHVSGCHSGMVVGLLAAGRSREEILKAYPYLEPEDIDQALAYAAWRVEERDVALAVE